MSSQTTTTRGNQRQRGRGNQRGRGGHRGGQRGGQSSGSKTNTDNTPASQTKALAEAQVSAANDANDDEEVCWICAEPVKYYSVSECDHRTCHVCALRLRALYKKLDCTFCKVSPFSPPTLITLIIHSRPHNLLSSLQYPPMPNSRHSHPMVSPTKTPNSGSSSKQKSWWKKPSFCFGSIVLTRRVIISVLDGAISNYMFGGRMAKWCGTSPILSHPRYNMITHDSICIVIYAFDSKRCSPMNTPYTHPTFYPSTSLPCPTDLKNLSPSNR